MLNECGFMIIANNTSFGIIAFLIFQVFSGMLGQRIKKEKWHETDNPHNDLCLLKYGFSCVTGESKYPSLEDWDNRGSVLDGPKGQVVSIVNIREGVESGCSPLIQSMPFSVLSPFSSLSITPSRVCVIVSLHSYNSWSHASLMLLEPSTWSRRWLFAIASIDAGELTFALFLLFIIYYKYIIYIIYIYKL